MDNCKHVTKIRPNWNHSCLNPQKWLCYICGTTESVWACLSCPNVACGRFNEEHALKHYQESKHPLSIEVNNKYVYCYECDDYVMNDNAAGDLKILRSALSAIATQTFTDVESRGRRLLRSYSVTAVASTTTAEDDDRLATSVWHYRHTLLTKTLRAWTRFVKENKEEKTPRKTPVKEEESPSFLRRRTLIPGMTGLRNLGNTCYMNSILQILSHIEVLRDFFRFSVKQLSSRVTTPENSPTGAAFSVSPRPSIRMLSRQTTTECFQYLNTKTPSTPPTPKLPKLGGLNGGSSGSGHSTPVNKQLILNVEDCSTEKISMCQELNGLFRVLWSGRWAQVSPHAFLHSVWHAIPAFKGHAQHDAQEFLCELLDKLEKELDDTEGQKHSNILTRTFQGKLVSQVKCLKCKNLSSREDPFLDLSLEFPQRYQITSKNSKLAEDPCHLTEMLAQFTDTEELDGEIYHCEKCNAKRKKDILYTKAEKRLLIKKLPPVLRLHLKRFRWSGRLHREKIHTPAMFDEVLDMGPFCDCKSDTNTGNVNYRLTGVVIHHGTGFKSGHYTANCWNSEAESWINFNDSRVRYIPIEEVLLSQAYILIYQRQEEELATPIEPDDEEVSTSIDSQGLSLTLKKEISQKIDEDITFNFKTPPLDTSRRSKRKRKSTSDTPFRIIKRRRSTLW
ncbi:ubiquitin carboxyl-terminal hydrolase 44-like isoform X1 [Mytilus edulis]|uniref:ubiquitin carboxyl-terminal hydrolase 44-like isoform X1 n=1 Tax=Mytilus edulis TaxID=6550 RepID=UPI0039EFFC1B